VSGGGASPSPLRTNVYIDGFNLYFGCLKHTAYKWLDVAELCRLSLPAHYHVGRIRYFTALVSARPNNPHSRLRQQIFLRALATTPKLDIHYGTFMPKKHFRPLATPVPGLPPFVEVLDSEEKGSDVNLATYLLYDAFNGEYDAAVVISDDSDLAEPIRIIRHDPKFRRHVTVLSPRGKSRVLSSVATRFRQIEPANLQAAQFPPTLTDVNGIIRKPPLW
jgi:hypothetical protein